MYTCDYLFKINYLVNYHNSELAGFYTFKIYFLISLLDLLNTILYAIMNLKTSGNVKLSVNFFFFIRIMLW